jgi:hypothetical protein
MNNNPEDLIIQYIKNLSEEDAKMKLAELLLNYRRIGIGGYSEEKCMQDYGNIYKEIMMRHIYKGALE